MATVASLVTVNGLAFPFQTNALLAEPTGIPPVDVRVDLRTLHPYRGTASAALDRAIHGLHFIFERIRVGSLTIIDYDSDDHDFDTNEALNRIFSNEATETSYSAPPTFILDFGDRLYLCKTPVAVRWCSASMVSIRNVYMNWGLLAATAHSLRELSIERISSPTQRVPVSILRDVFAQCAGGLEHVNLDCAVDYTDTGIVGPLVDLVALKSLSLGYQFVKEAEAVMRLIAIPQVDTLSLRDGARDLPLGYVNDSTTLLYIIAQKKEAHDYCLRLSLTNIAFKNDVVDGRERLAKYFLRTVCAADALNLLYDEDLADNAVPFIKEMGEANTAIGTKYLRVQGVDYALLMEELIHFFVRRPGDTRPRDEAILEPAHVDIIHSDMDDPDNREGFIQHFVTSGLASTLRVRASVTDEAETGTQWEPSTPLALQWHAPIANEQGHIDWDAYRGASDAAMSVD